jgi:hypothetical protein
MMTEQEFWDILHQVPETKPVFFRLYYDDLGAPVIYTMEHLPGNYIEVDAETYARAPSNVCVKNGQLIEIIINRSQKLVPGDIGTPCHPHDVAVVVTGSDNTQWKKQQYES